MALSWPPLARPVGLPELQKLGCWGHSVHVSAFPVDMNNRISLSHFTTMFSVGDSWPVLSRQESCLLKSFPRPA